MFTSMSSAARRVLTLEDIARVAPSVFAAQPWGEVSEKYRYIPTGEIVKGLLAHGFVAIAARQSNTRIEGKQDFTRHMIRFRHEDMRSAENLGGVIPEIVLLNSHDGSSSYQIDLGLYRKVCMNGLHVKSQDVRSVRVRHSGKDDIIEQVIEGSYQIVTEAPKVIEQINHWQNIELDPKQQEAFAAAALQVRDTTLDVPPAQLLAVRRADDRSNDVWTTFNRVQENLTKGGVWGHDSNKRMRRLRGVNSVDSDTKLNRALWALTEKMAELSSPSARAA